MGGVGGAGIGIPELVVLFVIVFAWGIPLVAGIWALFTLHKVRVEQRAMRRTVDSIEQLLQRR